MRMAEKHQPDWKRSVGPGNVPFWNRRWTAPLLLFLIVAGFYWKLTLTNQFTWLANNDLSSMVLPWMQFQASEWHAGRIPLWDPYSWGGQPLLAQAQPGSAYPLNWLLFLAPLKHTWIRQAALNWYYVLVRILAAWCFYKFARDLGRSRKASLVAASVYGIAGYLGSIEWPQMVNGAVWAPLVFMYQFRAARGERPLANSASGGFFLGLMWLCGHHQLPLFVSLASGLLWTFFILRRRRFDLLRCAAIMVGVGILVSALQTLPTAEYGLLAQRWSGSDHPLKWKETVPYAVHEDFSFKPLGILSFVIPGFDVNEDPLVGALAFTLAIIGLSLAWNDQRVRWLCCLGLGGLIFALGPNSLWHGLAYATTPMIDKARVPAQAMILFHLAICGLLAFGVDLFPSLRPRGAAVSFLTLGALGVLLCIAGFVLFQLKLVTPQGDSRFMVTALASLIGAAILWAAWRGTLGLDLSIAILLGLMLLEISNTSGFFFANYERNKDRVANLKKMSEDSDIRDFLAQQGGRPFRVEYDGEVIPHNLGDWWGIETFTSYVASAPDIVMRNEPYHPRVQSALGVRYYIGSKPLRPDQSEVFAGASGRKVYRNADSFPRVWVVHQTRRANIADTGRLLTDGSVDLHSQAIVTREIPALETCSGDQVEVKSHLPNRVTLEADMQCRGLVILSETYFPGWKVSIDGKEARMFDADGMLRGVAVDRGKHTILMIYRPWSVLIGAGLTLVGTMIPIAVVIRRRKNINKLSGSMI